MADPAVTDGSSTKRRFRWGRVLATVIFLLAAGAGLYGASWLNARRYFLIVDAREVRVARGKMLPAGYAPFVPDEIDVRRAYEPFLLPSGIRIPRGEMIFSDRVELDQALYRILKDAIAFALSQDSRSTPELVARYLRQMKAIPGTSVSQQLELAELEREAAYVEARHHLAAAASSLQQAVRLFRESARGRGSRAGDGEARARGLEILLGQLDGVGSTIPAKNPEDSAGPPGGSIETSTQALPPSGAAPK